jgi:hypothetical protein
MINEYPKTIFANALLLNNEIVDWKVVPSKWDESDIDRRTIYHEADITKTVFKFQSWVVNNKEENDNVFTNLAPEWYSQFGEYKGDGINP